MEGLARGCGRVVDGLCLLCVVLRLVGRVGLLRGSFILFVGYGGGGLLARSVVCVGVSVVRRWRGLLWRLVCRCVVGAMSVALGANGQNLGLDVDVDVLLLDAWKLDGDGGAVRRGLQVVRRAHRDWSWPPADIRRRFAAAVVFVFGAFVVLAVVIVFGKQAVELYAWATERVHQRRVERVETRV